MTIDGLVLGTLAPGAIAASAVLLVLTGRLIPRSTHRTIVAGKDQEISYLREALGERSNQVTALLTGVDTSTRAIEALTEVAGVRKGPS